MGLNIDPNLDPVKKLSIALALGVPLHASGDVREVEARWCMNPRLARASSLAEGSRREEDGMPSKRSRVHPRFKTRYRVTNWPEYDRGLVDRGDLTLWISREAFDS